MRVLSFESALHLGRATVWPLWDKQCRCRVCPPLALLLPFLEWLIEQSHPADEQLLHDSTGEGLRSPVFFEDTGGSKQPPVALARTQSVPSRRVDFERTAEPISGRGSAGLIAGEDNGRGGSSLLPILISCRMTSKKRLGCRTHQAAARHSCSYASIRGQVVQSSLFAAKNEL